MKIPVITWTVLELGTRNPLARELFTKTRRCVGKFIAGEDVTRNDFRDVQTQLANLKKTNDAIKDLLLQEVHQHAQTSPNDRLDHPEVRPSPVRHHTQPEGPMETGTGNRKPPIPSTGI